jgi:hypothetical protein
MVNRTNNALESYNHQFNHLFPKIPTLIEFVQLVEQETRDRAEKLDIIRIGKHHELLCEKIGYPISL